MIGSALHEGYADADAPWTGIELTKIKSSRSFLNSNVRVLQSMDFLCKVTLFHQQSGTQNWFIHYPNYHCRRLRTNTNNMLLIYQFFSTASILNAIVSMLGTTIVGPMGLTTVEAQKIRSKHMSRRGTEQEIIVEDPYHDLSDRALQKGSKGGKRGEYFRRVSSFPLCSQIELACNDDTATLAEITTISEDGMTLVYTDTQTQRVGFVDISDPANPFGRGTFKVGGEPTSTSRRGKVRRCVYCH